MPRIALSIVSLLLLTSSALIAANDNPFARWEKLKSEQVAFLPEKVDVPVKTEQAKPESKAGSVAYFSATAPNAAGQPVAATPTVDNIKPLAKRDTAASGVKRERLRSGSLETSVATEGTTGSGVQTAAVSDDSKESNIQQVTGEFFESPIESAVGAEENPFEEFLGASADAQAEPMLIETREEAAFEAPEAKDSATTDFAEFGNDFSSSGFDQQTENATPFDDNATGADRLNGPQTPSITLQWVHHGEFSLGQECRVDLVLENTGQTLVRNVVADALLPQGLQVVKSDPAPSTVDGAASWTFGELQAGEKRTIELVVIPEQQGDTQVSAYVRMTGATTSSFAVTQPALAVRVEGPAGIEVGQQVNYSVRVANPGTGTARNVVIQAAIPEGLEHRQGGMLAIDIGTLNPGEQRRARLSITAVKGGDHKLAVRVVGDAGLEEEVIETVAVAEPRLNIGVRGESVVRAGQVSDYELIVVNEGRVDSSNVRAKYKVPAGFEFVKADVGGKFDANDGTINWFVGTLEPNQVRQFRVSLKSTVPGAAVHQVGVISEHGKMTMADHETMVKGNAELSLRLAADRSRIAAGDLVTYEIRVNNVGQSTAQNVGVSFELPPGLELGKITSPSEYVSDNGVVIFRSLDGLEAGKSVTISVQARCQREGHHRVRVRVASESIEEALIAEEAIQTATR